MALQPVQPIKRSSHGSGRRSAAPQPVQPGAHVSRISPADELQLACRLAECRRELLSIALLDAATQDELQRAATELASGARRASELIEPASAAGDAKLEFEQFSGRVQALQQEMSLQLHAWQAHAASGAVDAAVLQGLLERMLDLLKATPLSGDLTDRLLQASWAVPRAQGASGGAQLPRSLRAQVRRLDSEIEMIRSRFIRANQGLVAYIVQRYRGMGLRREDLMQEGNIGLLRAIEKFDHRRGTRFSVYAVWWIRQAVRRALANQSRTIRIPVHALAVRYALDQASKRLSLELGREPSEQELACATGVVPNGVAQLLGMVKEPLSLDAPRGPDTEASLGDSVADRVALSPNEQAARNERAVRLHGLLDGLSPREREMLRMRFGLDGADECTLEQIGQSFALTRERVRQIVTAALDKLHHQTQVKHLELEPTAD